MTWLLIPTRNRPAALAGVLEFLGKFYPKTQVIVADGSADEYKGAVKDAVTEASRTLAIDFRSYPYELPLFGRILDVLRGMSDPFVVMGSDDDFPFMEVFDKGEAFLRANDDFVTAMGMLVHVTQFSEDDLTARLGFARQIGDQTAYARSTNYARWSFSSMYAVTRREHLIERYERASKLFLAGFFDFYVGVHDAMRGKIKAFPEIGFIETRNFNHSYLRPEEDLIFLRRADDVMAVVETMRADLERFDGMDFERAHRAAGHLIGRRIFENCGVQPQHLLSFAASPLFNHPFVLSEIIQFHDLFTANTPIRNRYLSRMEFVRVAMQANMQSEDNMGEKRYFETLDDQAQNRGVVKKTKEIYRGLGNGNPGAKRPSHDGDFASENFNRRIDPKTWLIVSGDGQGTDQPAALGANGQTASFQGHLLVLGQSNVANHAENVSASDFGQFHRDGIFGPLVDPIPGGSGSGGSVWTRFAPLAKSRLNWAGLTISLLAQGTSSIGDWADELGPYGAALEARLPALRDVTPPITHIIWHQGEADTLLGTSTPEYVQRFRRLHTRVRKYLPNAKWIVCQATCRTGVIHKPVFHAQGAIPRLFPGCHAGPNTDLYDEMLRTDKTHFNDLGVSVFAKALCDTFETLARQKPVA